MPFSFKDWIIVGFAIIMNGLRENGKHDIVDGAIGIFEFFDKVKWNVWKDDLFAICGGVFLFPI